MARNPLFSTYRHGENRVTSSMLAVFERIGLAVLESLLAKTMGESSLQLVSFVNQAAGRGASVPDARISANFSYWFEVKTARNALTKKQLAEHLKSVSSITDRLLVITPDVDRPAMIDELGSPQVIWFNFKDLHTAIDAVLEDSAELVSDQGRFLLRELQALLIEDALIDTDDVVVVAAGSAYPEYLDHAHYVCQPNRAFRLGLTHMGFYADKSIRPEVARIRHRELAVPFTSAEVEARRAGDEYDQRVADAIEMSLREGLRVEGEEYGVFVLSPAADPATTVLTEPVVNDTTAKGGRAWAWTLSQRYTSLSKLVSGVTKTSELDAR